MIGKIVPLSLALAVAASSAQPKLPSANVQRKSSQTTLRNDPKCVFLREEQQRVRKESDDFASTANLTTATLAQLPELSATAADLATVVATLEEFAVRETILRLKSTSCERGVSLSSVERVPAVADAHLKHLQRVRARWQGLGGTAEDAEVKTITDRINAVYESEERSFYNADFVHADLDPDIIKDYPELLPTLRSSTLPSEQKAFLEQHSPYIRYAEAGRLYNILKGIDLNGTLGYAYTLRKSLAERAQQAEIAAQAEAGKRAEQAAREREQTARERADFMTDLTQWVLIGGAVIAVPLLGVLAFRNTKSYAKYKAIRSGQLRRRYAWGTKELILWEPGEAVVILKDKKLQAMVDATGGYRSISAWAGEEYKGRISYKTQLMKYTTDPIHTSDGVPVNFELGILWQIGNPNTYVSRIAADYHQDGVHEGQPRGYTDDPRGEKYFDRKLTETAEKWIRLMAGSTLREHICQLSAAKLISPSVQSYIEHYYQPAQQPAENGKHLMPTILGSAREALTAKMEEYGIRIEKLEVNELKLPPSLEDKLETVRLSFLQPAQAVAEADAKTIERRGFNQTQLEALKGLAEIIGNDGVAKIEFLKAIGLAKIPFAMPAAPPFAVLQPILSSTPPTPVPSLAELQSELDPLANAQANTTPESEDRQGTEPSPPQKPQSQ